MSSGVLVGMEISSVIREITISHTRAPQTMNKLCFQSPGGHGCPEAGSRRGETWALETAGLLDPCLCYSLAMCPFREPHCLSVPPTRSIYVAGLLRGPMSQHVDNARHRVNMHIVSELIV